MHFIIFNTLRQYGLTVTNFSFFHKYIDIWEQYFLYSSSSSVWYCCCHKWKVGVALWDKCHLRPLPDTCPDMWVEPTLITVIRANRRNMGVHFSDWTFSLWPSLPGSLASPNTTRTWTTWAGCRGRRSWVGPGVSLSSVTSLHHWRIILNVNNDCEANRGYCISGKPTALSCRAKKSNYCSESCEPRPAAGTFQVYLFSLWLAVLWSSRMMLKLWARITKQIETVNSGFPFTVIWPIRAQTWRDIFLYIRRIVSPHYWTVRAASFNTFK